jgi:pyridoxal 5'-phosphate synthase pdxT subunit
VRVNRNHFGRQTESFQANLDLPFLRQPDGDGCDMPVEPFRAIFIRAPIVEKLLPVVGGRQEGEVKVEGTIVAPSKSVDTDVVKDFKLGNVEVMGILRGRAAALDDATKERLDVEAGDIIAVRQANVFGTSFHPELTGDPRIHVWWLEQVIKAVDQRRHTP